jgi:nucleoside-diphosphate-sugar epimerase
MTFGFDVAIGIKAVLGSSDALSEDFNITTTESLLWSEILKIYLDVLENYLNYRPKVVLVNMINFLKYHPSIYQMKYDRLFRREFDNKKISKYMNDKHLISANEGLRYCLEEFLKNPTFKQINWKSEALKDRKTNEFTKLSEIEGIKQKVKYLLFRLFIK